MQTTTENRPWGTLFAAALLLLGGLLVTDVLVAEWGRTSHSIGGERDIGAERTVVYRSIMADPGDVVRLHLQTDFGDPFGSYTFYAVEGGTGQAFLQGGTPEHVYAQHDVTPGGAAPAAVHIERPTPPADASHPDRLDLVWVLTYSTGNEPPSDPQARQYYDRWIQAELVDIVSTPEVASNGAVLFHKAATWAIYLLAAATLVTGTLWARRTLQSHAHATDDAASAGLAVVQLGQGALRFLRGMLLALALPLLYGGWLTMAFFTNLDTPGPNADWTTTIVVGFGLVLVAALLAWAVSLYAVIRADRRLHHHTAHPPLP